MARYSLGQPVAVQFQGAAGAVEGQVWSPGPFEGCGFVIVALDGGRYARVWTHSGDVDEVDSLGRPLAAKGKVAAR